MRIILNAVLLLLASAGINFTEENKLLRRQNAKLLSEIEVAVGEDSHEHHYVTNCVERTFEESVDYCSSIGMRLASFHSEEEFEQILSKKGKLQCNAYIGATSDGSGSWSWLDGSDWWQYHVNDGLNGIYQTKLVVTKSARWSDWSGTSKQGAICMEDSATETRIGEQNKLLRGQNMKLFTHIETALGASPEYVTDCTERNFQQSKDYCTSIGMQMASFHNAEEFDQVLNKKGKLECNAYIGATSDGDGNWSWLDGSTWWQHDVNDGLNGVYQTKLVVTKMARWSDWSESSEQGVICMDGKAISKQVGANALTETFVSAQENDCSKEGGCAGCITYSEDWGVNWLYLPTGTTCGFNKEWNSCITSGQNMCSSGDNGETPALTEAAVADEAEVASGSGSLYKRVERTADEAQDVLVVDFGMLINFFAVIGCFSVVFYTSIGLKKLFIKDSPQTFKRNQEL